MGPHGSGHAPCIPPKTHANVGCLNTQSLLPPAASSNDETHEQKHRLSARFSPLGSTKTVPKLGGCTARWLFSNKAVLDCKRCHKQLYILNILLYIHKARVQAYLPLYTIIYIYIWIVFVLTRSNIRLFLSNGQIRLEFLRGVWLCLLSIACFSNRKLRENLGFIYWVRFGTVCVFVGSIQLNTLIAST